MNIVNEFKKRINFNDDEILLSRLEILENIIKTSVDDGVNILISINFIQEIFRVPVEELIALLESEGDCKETDFLNLVNSVDTLYLTQINDEGVAAIGLLINVTESEHCETMIYDCSVVVDSVVWDVRLFDIAPTTATYNGYSISYMVEKSYLVALSLRLRQSRGNLPKIKDFINESTLTGTFNTLDIFNLMGITTQDFNHRSYDSSVQLPICALTLHNILNTPKKKAA